MTTAEIQARLGRVNECIDRILEGSQEASFGSKSYKEADLPYLIKYAERLEAKIEKESRGGLVTGYVSPS